MHYNCNQSIKIVITAHDSSRIKFNLPKLFPTLPSPYLKKKKTKAIRLRQPPTTTGNPSILFKPPPLNLYTLHAYNTHSSSAAAAARRRKRKQTRARAQQPTHTDDATTSQPTTRAKERKKNRKKARQRERERGANERTSAPSLRF